MKSLRCLYRVGAGPSSSHTIGPFRIAKYIKETYKDATSFDVTLFGSLALTGRGHLTDVAMLNVFFPIPATFKYDITSKVDHPNSLSVLIHFSDGTTKEVEAKSLGGGAIHIGGVEDENEPEIYRENNFEEIKKICKKMNWSLVDYVRENEGESIFKYLDDVYSIMEESIARGLKTRGILPGNLKVERRASNFLNSIKNEDDAAEAYRLVFAYAFAVGEENASGGIVATAPTCGSAATLPAVLKYYGDKYHKTRKEIIDALAVAGIIGNVIKQNGSISGAEAGCQAEIGSACSMAAAAYSYLKGMNIDQIECAAEVAMEHSLGSTCDPVGGYVIIPCIERNAIAANRAVAASRLAEYATNSHRVSFDEIVETMLKTGKDLKVAYRETSKGGLAKHIKGEK